MIGAGVEPCRAIYHFYPVSGNPNVPTSGVYDPSAQAEVVRDARGYLTGLTFAPKSQYKESCNVSGTKLTL